MYGLEEITHMACRGWGQIQLECLDCGSGDLRLRPALGEAVQLVFVCRDCDAGFDNLPVQNVGE